MNWQDLAEAALLISLPGALALTPPVRWAHSVGAGFNPTGPLPADSGPRSSPARSMS
jgi:hypothetical protein